MRDSALLATNDQSRTELMPTNRRSKSSPVGFEVELRHPTFTQKASSDYTGSRKFFSCFYVPICIQFTFFKQVRRMDHPRLSKTFYLPNSSLHLRSPKQDTRAIVNQNSNPLPVLPPFPLSLPLKPSNLIRVVLPSKGFILLLLDNLL